MTLIRARVTKEFPGVEDGKVYPRVPDFAVGEEISGDLAKTAIDAGWAKETRESAKERGANEAAEADRLAAEQADREAVEAKAADRAKLRAELGKHSRDELVAIAEAEKVDIATLQTTDDIIDAIARAAEAKADAVAQA